MNAIKITALSGSLRAASFSSAVLRTLPELFPADVHVEFTPLSIDGFPHYNQDLDLEETPAYVARARTQVAESDLVVIVTPEFNHGIPGVLKNALDWISRPAFSSAMVNKLVLFMTLSPGALGGVRAQQQMRETLSSMLCRLPPQHEIVINNVDKKITHGVLHDEATRAFIATAISKLLSLVGQDRS
jgi:chromate reductase